MQQSGFDVFSIFFLLMAGAAGLFTLVIFGLILAWLFGAFRKSGNRQGTWQSPPTGHRSYGGGVNGVVYTDTYIEMQPTSLAPDNTQTLFESNTTSDAGSSADFSAGQDNSGGVDFGASGSSNDFSSSDSNSCYDSGGSADFSSSSSSSSDFSSSDSGSSTSSSDAGSSSGGDY